MQEAIRKTSRPLGFVGRGSELVQLDAGLDNALEGRGRLFLLSGEPGIGKSRLAEEFSERAAKRGARVIWGQCWEGAGAPPYWPLIQIVRALIGSSEFAPHFQTLGEKASIVASIVPEIGQIAGVRIEESFSPPKDPEQARFQLFDAVTTLFKAVAASQRLALVIDDLHDADQSSMQTLSFMATGLKDSRVVMLGTYREAEVRKSPHLGRMVSELARHGLSIPLGGLSRTEVAELVEGIAGQRPDESLVTRLYDATDGNPLFVDGVVRLMRADGSFASRQDSEKPFKIPDGVRESIRIGLAALSRKANSTLSIGAVIGNEFSFDRCRKAASMSAEEVRRVLGEASGAGIVVALGGGRYRFAHALVRDSLYEEIEGSDRIKLHRKIGEVIEESHREDLKPRYAELAYHFREGEITEKAIDYSIRAGDAASSVFAFEEALSQWESALALLNKHGGDLKRKAAVLTELGVMLQISDTHRGIGHLEAALSLYEEVGDGEHAADLNQRLGLFFSSPGALKDVPRALIHAKKAEAFLRKSDTAGLASACYALGQAAKCEFRMRDALFYIQRAMEVSERAGAINEWCACAAQHGLYLIDHGRVREARAIGAKVWDKIPALTIPLSAFATFFSGGGIHSQLWDFPGAQKWWQRALGSSLLASYQRQVLSGQLGGLAIGMGDLTLARRYFEKAEEQHRSALAFIEGDWEGSRARVEGIVRWIEKYAPEEESSYKLHLARILRLFGEPGAASNLLEGVLEKYPFNEPHLQVEMHLRPELALLYAESDRLELAQRQVGRCDEILADGEDWLGLAGHAARAAAVYATADGRFVEADNQFANADKMFSRFSLVWERADNLQRWGWALIAASETGRANEKLDAAIAIYRKHGAGQRWIDYVEADRGRAVTPLLTHTAPVSHPSKIQAVFRKKGSRWTIEYEGRSNLVKDSRGLGYIAMLLANPGQEFRAFDLIMDKSALDSAESEEASGSEEALASDDDFEITEPAPLQNLGMHVNGPGDAGEMLDQEAKEAYRRRLIELDDEVERALDSGNHERVLRAKDEIENLSRELSRAVGFYGNDRVAASALERARSSVRRAIKAAMDRIAEDNPSLARLLTTTIKTGSRCSFRPDPRFPVSWQL